ncbi:LuxR family transcriptional regulator [Rhizobiaceae bacterium]|nr:LuxR family transcriptional regulator [Rhizobiaceae bacterium]
MACIRAPSASSSGLHELRDLYGLDTVSYHAASLSVMPQMLPYVRSTYSSEWIKHYVEAGYLSIDPIINEGFDRSLPFDWSELDRSSPEQKAFFENSIKFGLGTCGLSIPVTDKSGHRALFSVTSSHIEKDWEAFKTFHIKSLMEIAQLMHSVAMRDEDGAVSDIPKISTRERECLHWISLGKETPDIAIILGLSEHTIRSYLKSARLKLNSSTLAQAIFKCVQLGFLKV